MRSAAFPVAWAVWSRHRLGILASLAGLVFMILAYPLFLPRFEHQVGLLFGAILPVIILSYVGNLLIFSDEVGSLTSGYPRHMFSLPIRSEVLAFWPMSLAIAVMTSLWFILSLLVFRGGGYDIPVVLPAIGCGLLIAWFQALCWLPIAGFVVPYLAVGGIWLLIGAPFLLHASGTLSDGILTAMGLAAFPLLYLLACVGVAHARRGDRWDLGLDTIATALLQIRDRYLSSSRRFRSPEEAQLWFEESCQSVFLLGLITIQNALVFLVALFTRAENVFAHQMAVAVILATPLIVSASMAGALGRWCPIWVRRRDGLPFLAVRPMTSEVLIFTKYRMAWRIMWKTWAVAIILVAALVVLRRDVRLEASLMEVFHRLLPGWKGLLAVACGIPLILVVQWKMLTDNLVPAFTGRRWIADGMIFLSTALSLGSVAVAVWCVRQPWILPYVVAITAWAAVALQVIRLAIAAVAMRSALRRGLIERRSAAWIAILWIVAAAATIGLGVAFLPERVPFVPRPVLIAAPLVLLPTARFGLAPLALDWNRHR